MADEQPLPEGAEESDDEGPIRVGLLVSDGLLHIYTGVRHQTGTIEWRYVELPAAHATSNVGAAAISTAVQSLWRGDAGLELSAAIADEASEAFESMLDEAMPPDVLASQAHATASVAVSAEHERFSLLTLGYVGVLAGFLVDKLAALPSWSRIPAVIFACASMLAGLRTFWLSHQLAQARSGLAIADKIEELFRTRLVRESQRAPTVQAMLEFQDSLLWNVDKYLLKPLLDKQSEPWQRIKNANQILSRGVVLQSKWMRGQLIGAALATLALVIGTLAPSAQQTTVTAATTTPQAASQSSTASPASLPPVLTPPAPASTPPAPAQGPNPPLPDPDFMGPPELPPPAP